MYYGGNAREEMFGGEYPGGNTQGEISGGKCPGEMTGLNLPRTVTLIFMIFVRLRHVSV